MVVVVDSPGVRSPRGSSSFILHSIVFIRSAVDDVVGTVKP